MSISFSLSNLNYLVLLENNSLVEEYNRFLALFGNYFSVYLLKSHVSIETENKHDLS